MDIDTLDLQELNTFLTDSTQCSVSIASLSHYSSDFKWTERHVHVFLNASLVTTRARNGRNISITNVLQHIAL